jgi:CubicO group peptidase (beta-lactamase class C family)
MKTNNAVNSDVWKMWIRTMMDESETLDEYASSLRWRDDRPGRYFTYRSIDSAVLGILVNRVTGEPLAEMLSRTIWQPLGMEHDATWLTDKEGGLETGYCCINATLREYARFGLMFLNGGRRGSAQIVPMSWVDAATNPQSPQVSYGRPWSNFHEGKTIGYSYQWWIPSSGAAHPFSAVGLCEQYIYVNPKYDMVIVKTSAADQFFSLATTAETFAAFDAVGRFLETNR